MFAAEPLQAAEFYSRVGITELTQLSRGLSLTKRVWQWNAESRHGGS